MKTLAKFAKCESGATAIEYGLIGALVGVAILTIVSQTGSSMVINFTKIKNAMNSV